MQAALIDIAATRKGPQIVSDQQLQLSCWNAEQHYGPMPAYMQQMHLAVVVVIALKNYPSWQEMTGRRCTAHMLASSAETIRLHQWLHDLDSFIDGQVAIQ